MKRRALNASPQQYPAAGGGTNNNTATSCLANRLHAIATGDRRDSPGCCVVEQQQQQHYHQQHHQYTAAATNTTHTTTSHTHTQTHTHTTPTANSSSGHNSGATSTTNAHDIDWKSYTLVTLVAIVCYLNGLSGDFVHDDIPAITKNKDVLGTSPILHVFKNDFWGTPMSDINSHKSYRPLTVLSFRANYLLFGLRPMWFHATNVLLHAIACILFTRVCSKIAGMKNNFSIVAGLLFAVHPIHTEAVTGIVGRADILACIFFLVSLLLYHGHSSPHTTNTTLWLSIALGGLSMLAKETGITVFLLNLTYDIYRCWPAVKQSILDVRWTKETQLLWQRISKVLISMGVLLAFRLALLQGSFPKFSQQDNPAAFHPNIYVRILTFCYLAAFNSWLVLCPSSLSHDWQMGSIPLFTSISDVRNLMTLAAVMIATFLVYRGLLDFEQHKHVPLVLGFLLVVLPFMPATNLLVTVGFVVAERVLYIPSLGCILLVVYGAQLLWYAKPKYQRIICIFGAVLFAAGTSKTISRNYDWFSRESLLRSGLSVLPHNAKMHYNFGNYLRDESQPDLAIRHYQEAIRLWPTYASAHNNLGTLMKGPSAAEHHFLEALRHSADHVNAHYNLGKLYRTLNKTQEAVRMLEKCVLLEPTFAPAYMELTKIKHGIQTGRLLLKTSRLNTGDPEILARFGIWLQENRFLTASIRQFHTALSIDSTHRVSFTGICRTLRKLGQMARLHQFISRWQLILRISNDDGMIRQAEIYLRDWSIKNELRNRAMAYDAGLIMSSYDTASEPPMLDDERHHQHKSSQHTSSSNMADKIFSDRNCNGSENFPLFPKTILSPALEAETESGNSYRREFRSKRWTNKVKIKFKETSHSHIRVVSATDDVVPLLLPNIMDKL